MEEIVVGLGERRYPLRIAAGWIERLGAEARAALPKCRRVLVVTDERVGPLHAAPALEALRGAGFEAESFEIAQGETNKTVATAARVWDRLVAGGFTRQDGVVALGGGIVGDVAGFAAASYMRGIDFIQVPTTLLAMVDSSVGGKTGVNHPQAKNMIGAFWQPKLVFMELDHLRTLEAVEFRAGFAEALKHGFIRDAAYLDWMEAHLEEIFALDADALARLVKGSCAVKSAVVAEDEREGGVRAILNFGHTLGHAVEALSEYGAFRHGEAVAIGMAGAAEIARRMGLCAEADAERIREDLRRAGLPTRFPALETADVLERLKSDKKVRDDRVRFVLPTGAGAVTIRDDVPEALVRETIEAMR